MDQKSCKSFCLLLLGNSQIPDFRVPHFLCMRHTCRHKSQGSQKFLHLLFLWVTSGTCITVCGSTSSPFRGIECASIHICFAGNIVIEVFKPCTHKITNCSSSHTLTFANRIVCGANWWYSHLDVFKKKPKNPTLK